MDCICCIGWLGCSVFLYRWILLELSGAGSYWLDWMDWILWIGLDDNGWMMTHIYCNDGTDGTDGNDGLDGALVGLGWDGRLLAPAGTGATEQEHHHWLSGY